MDSHPAPGQSNKPGGSKDSANAPGLEPGLRRQQDKWALLSSPAPCAAAAVAALALRSRFLSCKAKGPGLDLPVSGPGGVHLWQGGRRGTCSRLVGTLPEREVSLSLMCSQMRLVPPDSGKIK